MTSKFRKKKASPSSCLQGEWTSVAVVAPQLFCFPACAHACDHTCLWFFAKEPSHRRQTPKQSSHLRNFPQKTRRPVFKDTKHIVGSASCLEIETWSTRDAGSLDALKSPAEEVVLWPL